LLQAWFFDPRRKSCRGCCFPRPEERKVTRLVGRGVHNAANNGNLVLAMQNMVRYEIERSAGGFTIEIILRAPVCEPKAIVAREITTNSNSPFLASCSRGASICLEGNYDAAICEAYARRSMLCRGSQETRTDPSIGLFPTSSANRIIPWTTNSLLNC